MLSSLASTVRRASLCVAALCVASLLPAGCGCPPLVAGYASPEDTLLAWQAHLCRDDAQSEYGCLAASFQRDMGGFQQYHAARAALLEEQPTMAWLFARSDLLEHVVDTQRNDEAGVAILSLRSGDDQIEIGFERETWLTIVWADGRRESFNQEQPLAALLGSQLNRQWLLIMKPALRPDQLQAVRALSVEPRWKIAALGGLDARAAAGPDASAGVVP